MVSFYNNLFFRSVVLSGFFATAAWPLSVHANKYVAPFPLGSPASSCTSVINPCTSLASAVAAAQPNETIFINSVPNLALAASNITVNKSLTFVGTGAPRVIINASNNGRHFTITGATTVVTLTNLELRNGVATSGGSIYNSALLLTLLNTALINNQATNSDGGAIFNTGTLVVNNSDIDTNTAVGNGGGIANNWGTVRVIGGSDLHDNRADNGGGIYSAGSGANVQITQDSLLSGNSATDDFGDGGCVYVGGGSTLQMYDSMCDNNRAEDEGGAIYANGGNVTLSRSSFENNSVGTSGGAVAIHSGKVTVTLSRFARNTATGRGGAIVTYDSGQYAIRQSSFESNSAALGGAVFDDAILPPQTPPSTIIASTFEQNSTAFDGGAVFYLGNTGLQIVNSSFSRNTANGEGGAFWTGFQFMTGTITIANSTFFGNAAVTGATIFTGQGLTMNNNIVTHSEDPSTVALNDGTACDGPALPLAGRSNLVGTAPFLDPSCGSFASGFALSGVTNFSTALADNGGPDVGVNNDPLETHALLTGSNAIGVGWNGCPDPTTTTGTPLTVDQISQTRPGGGNACDVGAFELQ